MARFSRSLAAVAFSMAAGLCSVTLAQTGPSAPPVKQIDEVALKQLITPAGKPLMINFWATWCVPCREEFPDLVRIDKEFRGKIDLITISLDEVSEIARDVPKFLIAMKAEMPAYLLRSTNEDLAIGLVTKEWKGGLPFTIIYDKHGATAYFRQGKIKEEVVRKKLNELLQTPAAATPDSAAP